MECFGDSDSSDDEIGRSETRAAKRDESCGVCSFHPNTEASLLTHVRNCVKSSPSSISSPVDVQTKIRRSSDVLEAIDAFCISRHWMMHVGPEKGGILIESLREAMKGKENRSSLGSITPFIAVELGSYCGYAAILMGRAFYEAKPATLDCHLFTTEINPICAEIASEMIQLSGVEEVVSVLQIFYNGHDTDVVSVVEGSLKKRTNQHKIDFLFIDHDKNDYKADLCKLESSGLICRGTRVVADNVLFAGIAEYVTYVQQKETEGIVNTRTIPCHVEYCDDDQPGRLQQYKDGIEITDYLRDP